MIDELCDALALIAWNSEPQNAQTITKAIALLKKAGRTGHWIYITTSDVGFPRYRCSECNSEAGTVWMKHCPNCGVKMEKT